MADTAKSDDYTEVAFRIQEKYEFYVLALTFTLVGLSVQTAQFGASVVRDILELLGWCALIVSGLAGLSRLEWMPVIYSAMSKKAAVETQKTGLQRAALQGVDDIYVLSEGRNQKVNAMIQSANASAETIDERLRHLTGKAGLKYQVQQIGFLVGLFLLVAARGWLPAAQIVRKLSGS